MIFFSHSTVPQSLRMRAAATQTAYQTWLRLLRTSMELLGRPGRRRVGAGFGWLGLRRRKKYVLSENMLSIYLLNYYNPFCWSYEWMNLLSFPMEQEWQKMNNQLPASTAHCVHTAQLIDCFLIIMFGSRLGIRIPSLTEHSYNR